MKIAVSAMGGSLESRVSEQFGRCSYFLLIEPENMKFEPVSNPGIGMSGGAGPEAARIIASRGVRVLLTGRIGLNAKRALGAAGIRTITGISGSRTVRQAIDAYLKRERGLR